MKKISLFTLGLSSLALSIHAGSFQLPNQGLEQSSMGGTGVAYPFNAASIFYNPALLSRMDNFQFNGNIGFLNPNVRYVSNYGTTLQDNINRLSTPFAMYLGGKFDPESRWGFGLGVFTPYGSSLNWGDDWSGRYLVQDIKLSTIFFQPTISYQISDVVSLGVGFDYAIGNLEMSKALPVQNSTSEGKVELEGRAKGIGFNAGLSIVPTDNISIGINYRSAVDMKLDKGVAKFSVPNSLVGNFPNTNFTSEMNLPHVITVGVAAKITPMFILAGDLVYSTWTRYQYTNFDFEINTPSLQDQVYPRHYENTLAIRLGGQYRVTEDFTVLAGAFYDPTPTRKNYMSPEAVDGNRLGYSFGVSYEPVGRLKLNAAVTYVNIAPRDAEYLPLNFSGTYQVNSLSPSFGITYKFID